MVTKLTTAVNNLNRQQQSLRNEYLESIINARNRRQTIDAAKVTNRSDSLAGQVEIINYAYSKYQDKGALFPKDHSKRGHMKSFKKIKTLIGANNELYDAD